MVNSICGLLKTSTEEKHGEDVNHRLQEGRDLSDSEEEGKAISEEKKNAKILCRMQGRGKQANFFSEST